MQQCAASGKLRARVGVEGHVREAATLQNHPLTSAVWKYAGDLARDVHPSVLIATGRRPLPRTPELLTLERRSFQPRERGLLKKIAAFVSRLPAYHRFIDTMQPRYPTFGN